MAALCAVARPILNGILYALKSDVVAEFGSHENLKLKMLARVYRAGDGDCGVCFEYAVHESLNNRDPQVLDRMMEAIRLCKVPGIDLRSILFGLEKSGAQQIIDTASDILTDDSLLLPGTRGRPLKLRRRLDDIAYNFRRRKSAPKLPSSVSGLWKTDIFVGCPDSERWVATTVKINPNQLVGAAGLRIGIVPTRRGRSDAIVWDADNNLVICPLLWDADFMETFHTAWRVVQGFIAADAAIPADYIVPRDHERELARILMQRREFTVLEVMEALRIFGQPGLLETQDKTALAQPLKGDTQIEMFLAPLPKTS